MGGGKEAADKMLTGTPGGLNNIFPEIAIPGELGFVWFVWLVFEDSLAKILPGD